MTDTAPVILWFRNDLRLRDHAALAAARRSGGPVIPVFVHDETTPGIRQPGGASRWWLHHSLAAHDAELRRRGSRLIILRGRTEDALAQLARDCGAQAIYALDSGAPWAGPVEDCVRAAAGAPLRIFGGSTLFPRGEIRAGSGGVYKVFSPFWKACLAADPPPRPTAAPDDIPSPVAWPSGAPLDDLALLPRPDWAGGLRRTWTPGEDGAQARLAAFLSDTVRKYKNDRDYPAKAATSGLSPHLAFGEISPADVWRATLDSIADSDATGRKNAWAFLRELGWRDFAHHLLDAFPDLPERNMKRQFDHFDWRRDDDSLTRWQAGRTGYPIVDAGMRELWETGWMHNRVRMIVASFLTKHLRLHWKTGEAWFWDTLVDADPANNAMGWQWVAGSGPDAAPYFRIFNPMTQSARFDPDGTYLRRWLPELEGLSDRDIHQPFAASADALAKAGVRLGENWPHPIVNHTEARASALAAFEDIKAA